MLWSFMLTILSTRQMLVTVSNSIQVAQVLCSQFSQCLSALDPWASNCQLLLFWRDDGFNLRACCLETTLLSTHGVYEIPLLDTILVSESLLTELAHLS